MKGRKAIPNRIIQLRGGTAHTHEKARGNDIEPPAKIPSCPAHLNKEAKKEWRRVVKILEPIGILSGLDMSILAEYCEAYGNWVLAKHELIMIREIYVHNDCTLKNSTRRVEQYRVEVKRWLNAMKMNQKGIVMKKSNGEPGYSPYLSVERDSADKLSRIEKTITAEVKDFGDKMVKAGTLIGMSPSSRASLSIHQQTKSAATNKTEMFRKLKHG